MSTTVRTYVDPVNEAVKSFQKTNKRHQKRAEDRTWQKIAREYRGAL